MRLFTATVATETNTFSPVPTSLQSFSDTFWCPPGTHPDAPSFCTAPLAVARKRAAREGWTLVEGTCTWTEPAGTCAASAYETIRDTILDELRAALPLDGVLLGLHGAMVAHGYDDVEGDLIARVRGIVGDDVVIGVEHDPHCHLTTKRLEGADILVTFKEFPHTDPVDRAEEVVDLTLRTIRGEIRPKMSLVDCRQIASYPTSREPMRSLVDRIMALEGQDGVLSISIAHGFPYGDVPDLGTRVLVITDDAKERGDRLADELASEMVAMRGRSMPPYLGIDEAIDQALANDTGKPVVIADSTDNPGGGAPGDSTHLLRRLIERGIEGAAQAPLWDPIAVRFCMAAGEGARLSLRFGGKTAPASGLPIDAEVEVLRLAHDAWQTFAERQVPLGDVALVRVGPVEVVLTSKRAQSQGLDLFGCVGVDPRRKRLLSLKSTNHFYAAFAPIAADVLYVNGQGPLKRDMRKVPYRRVTRPLWPLDDEASPVRLI